MMPTMEQLPLFRDYDISELARRSGLAETYLIALKKGWHEMNDTFKAKMCMKLGRSEEELFGPSAEGEGKGD